MLYFLAFAFAVLSAALEGTSSDVAAIGSCIFLGLAIQTAILKDKK